MRAARRLTLLLTGATLSACVLSREDVQFDLPSGTYALTWGAVTANSCFPAAFGEQPGSTDTLPIAVLGVSAGVGAFGALARLTSTMSGSYQSGELVVRSRRHLVVSTACSLDVLGALSATVFSPDPELAVGYGVVFDASTVSSAGGLSHCQASAGTTLNGVPFPTLSDPTSGACSYGLQGTATLLPR